MMADESRSGDNSIPAGGISVNAVLSGALDGTLARLSSCGLRMPSTATVADLTAVCCRLIRIGTKMSVTVQFCLGDTYQCAPGYSPERQALYNAVERQFGSKVADRLREFGRVAKNWPLARRNPDVCWAYYRTHKPGEPGKSDSAIERKELELTLISSEMADGVLVEHWRSPNGSPFFTRRKIAG